MESLLERIRMELESNSDESTRLSSQRFFKEAIQSHGVKSKTVNTIAKKYWSEIKNLEKMEIFCLCEELYRSDYCEESYIASAWVPNLADKFDQTDLALFKSWIERYVNNWAKCDTFCNHSIGSFIKRYPACIEEVKSWTESENRWLKRAAAVSLIIPAKHGEFLVDAFEIADRLLTDEDDLVQKGYGWLLKEASRHHQEEVYLYILNKRETMPRTALRYAIELMPPEQRREAMKRV